MILGSCFHFCGIAVVVPVHRLRIFRARLQNYQGKWDQFGRVSLFRSLHLFVNM